MYTTEGGRIYSGRVLNFFKGKGGMIKISEGRKGGSNFFYAIERLNVQ